MRRLSIRTRITLGSLAVALVLLIAALVIVRAQVAATLSNADVSLAESDLASFETDIRSNPDESVDDPGTGVLVYVRAPDGSVDVNTLPHDLAILVQDEPATTEQYTTTDDEGRTYVVFGQVVGTGDGEWALWSARSTSSSELALEGLDHVLVIAGLVLLAGFGIASWVLATVALRPVTAMRLKAEKLGADDAAARLPVGPANDELAALAATLNAFLERVHATTKREKQMVSDASHELRTPLAVLKTQLELAHADDGDAKALASHVRAAETSVDRLTSLASNLLELSRLQSGDHGEQSSSTTNLVDELMAAVDRARILGLAAGAEVSIDAADDAGDARYPIDSSSFGRLVDNLLANAVHAVGRGGSVSASLRTLGTSVVLDVRDDGPGMPEDFIPVAFERFSRPDSSRTAATGGSGLGLALAYAITRNAAGAIRLENTHPGLHVTVTIPKM